MRPTFSLWGPNYDNFPSSLSSSNFRYLILPHHLQQCLKYAPSSFILNYFLQYPCLPFIVGRTLHCGVECQTVAARHNHPSFLPGNWYLVMLIVWSQKIRGFGKAQQNALLNNGLQMDKLNWHNLEA